LQNANRSGKFSGKASGIRAVIFDYGEVLCRRAPLEKFAPMAQILRITPEYLLERYAQNRLDYDRGDLSASEYWTGFGRESGVSISAAQVEELDCLDCSIWWDLDPQIVDWVRRLRAHGIKAGVISNMFIGLAKQIRESAPWLHHFDHYTFSAELRVTKPDALIYRHSLDHLGVEPAQALFLDDRQANVEGARAIGMEGLLYSTPQQLDEDLASWQFPILPLAAINKIPQEIKTS
jgi:putative hydrolase of the HAD superfamily